MVQKLECRGSLRRPRKTWRFSPHHIAREKVSEDKTGERNPELTFSEFGVPNLPHGSATGIQQIN